MRTMRSARRNFRVLPKDAPEVATILIRSIIVHPFLGIFFAAMSQGFFA